jgi:predicted nucleotidyltransferase component of viral defense system
MKDKPTNLPASVGARLRNLARERGINLELILRRYALERLLLRLSLSPHRNRFVLKGAMLFTVWLSDPFRPTQDLDLLGLGDAEAQSIATTFRDICRRNVPADGLSFDTDGLIAETIREGQLYGGVRVRTKAFLGKTRIPIQVDVGFGDAVTPGPEEIEFPPLLHDDGPHLKAYPRETVIAEKFQAVVALGTANSRMKDFYDLLALVRLFPFDGRTVAAAVRATFDRRATPIPSRRPPGLGAAFASDPQKMAQWKAFTAREPLLIPAKDLSVTVDEIAAFIMPPVRAARANDDFAMKWNPSGPWRSLT